MDNEEIIMEIIAHSGAGRGYAMEAIAAAKENDFDECERLIKESNNEFLQAHKIQTDLITAEVSGKPQKVSLLMVHAQDHLMNALTVKDLAEEFIEVYKNIKK